MKIDIKLCYLYVEGSDGFEVNLDNQYEFKWDGQKININEKVNYIENFYGKNINNFNLIIGKNGAGKTTCLNRIIKLINNLDGKMIKIIKYNNEYYIFYHNEFKISEKSILNNLNLKLNLEEYNLDEFGAVEEKEDSIHTKIFAEESNIFQSIFYTNQFSNSNYSSSLVLAGKYNPFNIGLQYLLRFPEKMGKESNSVVNQYYSFFKYISALLYKEDSCKNILEELKIDGLKKVKIIRNIGEYNIITYLKQLNHNLSSNIDIENKINMNIEKAFFIPILYEFCLDFYPKKIHISYNEKRDKLQDNTDYSEELRKCIVDWLNKIDFTNSQFSYYLEQFKELKEILKEFSTIEVIHTDTFEIKFVERVEAYINLLVTINKYIEKFEYNNQGIFLDIIKYSEEGKELYSKALDAEISFEHSFVYEWVNAKNEAIKLSSGEEDILGLFGKLSFAYNSMVKPTRNERAYEVKKGNVSGLIIFLDEPDIYLHPEWKRKFMYCFLKFIEERFKHINVQIIITSNSPILAGDILKKDIIFLDDREIKSSDYFNETFAGNLLMILKKTFFMDSLIGEFSTKQINYLFDLISNENGLTDQQIIECNKRIDLIAEPIIKRRIQEQLDEKI